MNNFESNAGAGWISGEAAKPTPETDAKGYNYGEREVIANVVDSDFARQLERQRDEARKNINTSYRLFDLVRFMRTELHEQGLINDDEYSWLCTSSMATIKEGGSPSPRRLEEYDDCKAERDQLRTEVEQLRKQNEMDTIRFREMQEHGERREVENEQLRKCVGALFLALDVRSHIFQEDCLCQSCKAFQLYNQLPHVLERNKAK